MHIKNRGSYTMVPFPRMQTIVRAVARVARHKYVMRGLVELDVTRPRQILREYKARTEESLSFTAYLAAAWDTPSNCTRACRRIVPGAINSSCLIMRV